MNSPGGLFMTDERPSAVTGFVTYTTHTFRGFTNQTLHDIDVIIKNLFDTYSVAELKKVLEDLRKHITRSPDAHNITLSQIHGDVLEQLYNIYQLRGHLGSVNDMLLAIGKNIFVASHQDILDGISEILAVNVVEWKYLFDQHGADLSCHRGKFSIISPKYLFQQRPIFSFDRLFANGYENEYPISGWEKKGTILFDFFYDVSSGPASGRVQYFTLANDTQKASVAISIVDQSIILLDNDDHVVAHHELLVWPKGTDTIVISYTQDGIMTSLPERPTNIKSTRLFDFVPTKILFQSTFDRSISDVSHMRSLTYFNQYASEEDQTFLLN